MVNRLIEFVYYFDGKVFKEAVDRELKFKSIVSIAEVTHKMKAEDFEVFYLGYKLGIKYYSYPIMEIIRNDPYPEFYIKKHGIVPPKKSASSNKNVTKIILLKVQHIIDFPSLIDFIDTLVKGQYKIMERGSSELTICIESIAKAHEVFLQLKSNRVTDKFPNLKVSIKLIERKKSISWEDTEMYHKLVSKTELKPNLSIGNMTGSYSFANPFKPKHNMNESEKFMYLKSMDPVSLRISEPFSEVRRIFAAKERKEKTKWISKHFTTLKEAAIDPNINAVNTKLPVPMSREIRLKFEESITTRKSVQKPK